jgi:hypothetical protein
MNPAAAAFVSGFLAIAPALSSPTSPVTLATPTPASSAVPVVWQDVTLGEPILAAFARLGAPADRRKSIMGTTVYEFRALDGDGTLALTESGGIVASIVLEAADPGTLRAPVADPFGVALGDTADRLTELRGMPARYDDEGGGAFTSYYGTASDVRWAYGLQNDVVHSIGVIQPYRIVRASGAAVSVPTPRPANAPTPPPPDASSIDRAIKVTPDELAADSQFEFTYVRDVLCGTGDKFTPTAETIFNAKRRNISRIDAVCRSTGEQRSFYFDITAVFGRAEN